MKNGKVIAVVYAEGLPDSAETAQTAELMFPSIMNALQRLGYTPVPMAFSRDMLVNEQKLKDSGSFLVLNLVAPLISMPWFSMQVPIMLETFGIPFTGLSSTAAAIVGNRLITKKLLQYAAIQTPPWQTFHQVLAQGVSVKLPAVIKSVIYPGQTDNDDYPVYRTAEECIEKVNACPRRLHESRFFESAIEGNRILVSLLACNNDVEILGSSPGSENNGTVFESIGKYAVKCREVCELGSYSQIEITVDNQGVPWVTDIVGNPSLVPGSPFIAAGLEAGYTFEGIISRIIDDAYERHILEIA